MAVLKPIFAAYDSGHKPAQAGISSKKSGILLAFGDRWASARAGPCFVLVEWRKMDRIRLVIESFFRREVDDSHSKQSRSEVLGSVFALFALYLLVSLTSYLRIDTYQIAAGYYDRITNLGGIFGALLSEWTLGNLGLMGYSVLAISLYLAFASFQGRQNSESYLRCVGLAVGAILGAIASYLLFHEKVLDTSLLQGGRIGQVAGAVLEHYLNTTGALIFIAGLSFITLLLSTEWSLQRSFQNIFGAEAEEEEEELELATAPKTPKPKLVVVEPPSKPKAKKSRKKSKSKSEDETENAAQTESTEGTDDPQSGEAPAIEVSEPGGFQPLPAFTGRISLPSTRALSKAKSAKRSSVKEIKRKAKTLCQHLLSFQITGEIVDVSEGPILTTYEFKPDPGIKLKAIANLQDDLGIVLGTRELRIIAPIPGKTVVGIEIPRADRQMISLRELVDDKAFLDKKLQIPIAIGKATDGQSIYTDLAAMPHLLVAGATGSGKSVFINTTLMGFLYRLPPQELRLILIDPKMLELNMFNGLPHLVTDVITDAPKAFAALEWAVQEMDRRYQAMAETGSKNIVSYNSKQRNPEKKLPYLVIVVDELADLMLSGGDIVEPAITRLAQKARAAGIHLIIATQRPSTDVITGLIKANIPSRISFKVPSGVDSRTVLDCGGAEGLIGKGDMLMVQPASPLRRLHASFVTEEEIKAVVKSITGGRDFSRYYLKF